MQGSTASVGSDMAVVDATVGRERMRVSPQGHVTSLMGSWKSLDVLILIITFWGMFSNNVTNQAALLFKPLQIIYVHLELLLLDMDTARQRWLQQQHNCLSPHLFCFSVSFLDFQKSHFPFLTPCPQKPSNNYQNCSCCVRSPLSYT